MKKFCSKCGTENIDRKKFCSKCGQILDGTEITGEKDSVVKLDEDLRKRALGPLPSKENSVSGLQKYKKEILSVVILIIAISVGVGGYLYYQGQVALQEQTKQEETNSEANQAVVQSNSNNASNTVENNNSPKQSIAVTESKARLESFYTFITNRNYDAAYACLSESRKATLGNFTDWRGGYITTVSAKLVSAQVVSEDPARVVYQYELESRDSVNGQIKYQKFAGNVTMIKANNNWYIDDQDGRLITSVIEK